MLNNDSSNSQKITNTNDNQEIYKVYKNIYIKTENQYLETCKGRKFIFQIHIYFKLCEKGILFDKKVYEEVMKPKISIILPVRNREEYILRSLRSIQNQPMKDIEIIFIDDASTDKSVTLIEEYQKTDKRIILIKHEENQGTLKTRIEGIYKARGEYIQFVDSDDVLHYNILNIAYEEAQKGDYDIIQFKVARKKLTDERYSYYSYDRNTTPIYQPELSSLMYYYNGTLFQTDFHVWDKLIKREALIRALKSIKQYYLKQHMSINEDGVLDFMLLKTAKSYKFIYDFGYIYVANPSGAIYSLTKTINKTVRDYILYLRYLFEHTANNEYEKSMAGEQLRYVYKKFYKYLEYVTSNFNFIFDTLNLYLECPYISKLNKRKVKRMINKLEKAKDNVKQKNYKDDIQLEDI
jgi:glycosyltransferase involved in cell wall biosynthesis